MPPRNWCQAPFFRARLVPNEQQNREKRCLTPISWGLGSQGEISPLQWQTCCFHCVDPRIHSLDAKYDELHNYEFACKQGAIPLIDYNARNEKMVRESLLQRDYDRNGWPFVSYFNLPMRPNGFDAATQRLSFSCFKQCVKSKDPDILELYRNCPHRPKQLGFSTHVLIDEHPRLLLEIPRGTDRFRQLHSLRSAAERTNSTLKEDNAILRKPSARSLRRASMESLMGVITTLLDRVSRFVLDATVKERKFENTGDKAWLDALSPPEIPGSPQPIHLRRMKKKPLGRGVVG